MKPILTWNKLSGISRHLDVLRTACRLSVFGLAVFFSGKAVAANDAWATTPASGNFSGVNWTTGATTPAAPTGTAASGDALYFGTSSITSLTNDDSGYTFAGLTFNSGASTYTIGGNSFTLTGAITNNSTSLQTINAPIVLGAAETVNAASGAISLGGAITGSFVLTLDGINQVTLGGANSVSGLTLGTTGSGSTNTNTVLTGEYGVTANLNNNQSIGPLVVGVGANVINVGAGDAITGTTIAGTNTFTILNINLGAGASMSTTQANNAAGLLDVSNQINVVTLNGTDFATNSGGTIAAATYTTLGTTSSSSQNSTVTGNVTLSGNQTMASLRFGSTSSNTITVGSANTLSLNGSGQTGAILMAATDGAVTDTITGGSLQGGSNRGYSIYNYDTTSGASLVINSNINNYPASGSGSSGTASVEVAGGGVVTLGGTNFINGQLYIDGSTLTAGSDSNLGAVNGTVSVSSATNGSTSVTLTTANSNTSGLASGDVLLGQVISSISTNGTGTTVTLASAYTGTSITSATNVGYVGGGSIDLNGGTLEATGTFTLGETNTTGVTSVRNRNIGLGDKGGSIDVTNGNTLTVTGVISGSTGASATSGAFNKVDSGTLTLSGSAGNTNVFLNNMAGETILNNTSGIAASMVTITGGTVQLGTAANNNQTTNLAVNGGTFDLNGNNDTNSTIAILNGTGGTITNTSGSTATLYIGNGGATYTDTLSIASIISGATNINIQGASASTRVVNFSGADTYTGTTTIGAGTLDIVGAGQLGSGSYAANITDNGSLIYGSSASQTLGGTISGTGSFTQNGTATVTLQGANIYSGGTTITTGAINVANSSGSATGSSAVNVNGTSTSSYGTLTGGSGAANGGTLTPTVFYTNTPTLANYATGVGVISGSVTLNQYSHLAPGSSAVGTITMATLTINSGANLDYEFNSTANDFTLVTSALTLNGGTVNLYQEGGTTPFALAGVYDILGYSGATLMGSASALSVGDMVNGYSYNFVNDSADSLIQLDITAVPEPTTWAFTLLGLGILGYRLRRKSV